MEDPSRARVTGPLQPYAEGFTAELARLGYTSGSAYGQVLLMAHVSRWLAGEGLDAGGLTPETARFLVAGGRPATCSTCRRRRLRRCWGSCAGLARRQRRRLLPRRAGGRAAGPLPALPGDGRGIAGQTAAGYAARVRAFVAARADRTWPGA